MPLERVYQVSNYYQAILDDSDGSDLDPAAIAMHLERGEAEYRRMVSAASPLTFRALQSFAVGSDNYDLALVGNPVVLMGAGPLAPANAQRIARINMLSLGAITPGSRPTRINPAKSWEDFQQQAEGGSWTAGGSWILDGTILRFTGTISTTANLDYLPVSNVDWTQQATPVPPALGTWIDDLVEWHDLIALFGAQHYLIHVAREDPRIAALLARRLVDFRRYLTDGRIAGKRNRITFVP